MLGDLKLHRSYGNSCIIQYCNTHIQWNNVKHTITSRRQLYTQCIHILTYKTLNTSVPRYISQRINRHINTRTLRSTATPLPIQPFARTDFTKRSFRCATPSVWNSLPASVIGSNSLSVFKSSLKPILFRRSFSYHTQPTAAGVSEVTTLWRFTNMLIIYIISSSKES